MPAVLHLTPPPHSRVQAGGVLVEAPAPDAVDAHQLTQAGRVRGGRRRRAPPAVLVVRVNAPHVHLRLCSCNCPALRFGSRTHVQEPYRIQAVLAGTWTVYSAAEARRHGTGQGKALCRCPHTRTLTTPGFSRTGPSEVGGPFVTPPPENWGVPLCATHWSRFHTLDALDSVSDLSTVLFGVPG